MGVADEKNKEAFRKWQIPNDDEQRETAKSAQAYTTRSRQFVFEDSAKGKQKYRSPGESEEE